LLRAVQVQQHEAVRVFSLYLLPPDVSGLRFQARLL